VVKKALSGLGFLAALQSVSASAADIFLKAPKPQPPAFAWTGCYVGGHFGGSGGKKEVSDSSGGLSSVSTNTGGFLPGGQIGCDYQGPGNWVFGVQGSFSAYTLKGVTEFPNGSVVSG
jgi:outer membrane immunogenic protein